MGRAHSVVSTADRPHHIAVDQSVDAPGCTGVGEAERLRDFSGGDSLRSVRSRHPGPSLIEGLGDRTLGARRRQFPAATLLRCRLGHPLGFDRLGAGGVCLLSSSRTNWAALTLSGVSTVMVPSWGLMVSFMSSSSSWVVSSWVWLRLPGRQYDLHCWASPPLRAGWWTAP